MSEEVILDGKTYISSKRASEKSGYAQDYIGQLARKGMIDARRIGGLWYIFFDSLNGYKDKADKLVREAPKTDNQAPDPDSLVFFDGKDYISAHRASEITGYHQDYVGQLARSGKIASQQIGNRWYVDRAGIEAHKTEKDSLLAAVQVESVGLQPKKEEAFIKKPEIVADTVEKIEKKEPVKQSIADIGPLLTYSADDGDLIPGLPDKTSALPALVLESNGEDDVEEETEKVNKIPITVSENRQLKANVVTKKDYFQVAKKAQRSGKSMSYATISAIIFSIIVVLGGGYFMLTGNSSSGGKESKSGLLAAGSMTFGKAGDFIEPLITHEIVYVRQN